jgi:hypothetical protein
MVTAMADNTQGLHKITVCNNTELRTLKSRNCYATDDATAAQKDTVKASAIAVLRRNKGRNSNATGTETMRNNQRNKQPKVAPKVAPVADLKIQQASSDWRWFCDSHERTLPGSHCPIKHERLDPMTDCVGWQLKTGRSLH